MPELPEVETVRRRLAPVLEGRTFEDVEILDTRLTRPVEPLEVAAELAGERVERVDRRGKYLIVHFSSGRALLIHLRMTGTLLHEPEGATHVRALVTLDDGTTVAYRDVRRFGTWLLLEPGELVPYLDTRWDTARERARSARTPGDPEMVVTSDSSFSVPFHLGFVTVDGSSPPVILQDAYGNWQPVAAPLPAAPSFAQASLTP